VKQQKIIFIWFC